jgi:pimeloyl-ACP methyl ester carboxylesterase
MIKRKSFIVLLCVLGISAIIYVVHRWLYGPDNLPAGPDLSWVREPTDHTDKLLVFVHGIGSDSKSAWTSDRTGAYWPQLLANDQDLSSFAVLTASYRSPYIRHAASIEQAAEMLGTRLRDKGIYTSFSHVVFIAHSMGGLIVRRMLVNLVNIGDEPAVKRVAVVFFFGTPTSGAPLADLAKWVSANPQTSNLSASDLNAFVQALDTDWENLLRRRVQRTDGRPRIFCGYELQSTRFGQIVPAVYAKTWCDEAAHPFERDHFNLVKPDNDHDDPVYEWTKTRLLGANRRIGQVLWNGGESLGNLVERLRRAYRDGHLPEEVRFSPSAESKLLSLWIPKAEYRRDSWGELFQAVALDHPCLVVKIIKPGQIVELRQDGPIRTCAMRTICSTDKCERVQ